jgi:lipoic acid synthetase
MGLGYCVVTSVTRDDLPDMGASHWAETIKAIRKENPKTKIEVLIPEMNADEHLLGAIVAAGPDVAGHNIECVERLTLQVRSGADYRRSLRTISILSSIGATVKSGIMVGFGESFNEVMQTLEDLRLNGCEIVTIGQYLQPTRGHLPVTEYINLDMFALYRQKGMELGFAHIESGPRVRSSYMAERGFRKSLEQRGRI